MACIVAVAIMSQEVSWPASVKKGWPANHFFVGRFQSAMVTCLPRATARPPSGTFLVMTEPAPVVAPAPTSTGATRQVFEPIKAFSPITVRNLFTPS